MKRILLVVLLVLVVALMAFGPALAHEPHHCEDTGEPGNSEFGQHHAEHGQEGHLGAETNPGNHLGYSSCLDTP